MNELWINHCCAEKDRGPNGMTPDQRYLSKRIIRFISENKKKDWAILSAEYGLVFPGHPIPYYDTTIRYTRGSVRFLINGREIKKDENEQKLDALTSLNQKQFLKRNFKSLVYPKCNPTRQAAYLAVLHKALTSCREQHHNWRQQWECLKKSGILK